jgi:ABC-2 type transport system permease protein
MSQSSAAGAIYDIGYRRYDGPRLGRTQAVSALFWGGLRAIFGLGRSARSKVIPWGLVVLALGPALVALAIQALVGDLLELFTYDNYIWQVGWVLPLFVAAQAPELVVNDQRHHVLPLYFSRPIERLDYPLAKLAALTAGMLALTLAPLLVLFVGRIMSAEDVLAGLADEAPNLWQIVGSSLLHSVVIAVIGLAIAAYGGRRAYATGGVIAFFLVSGTVGSILSQIRGGAFAELAVLVSPVTIIDGVRMAFFGGPIPDSPVSQVDLHAAVYVAATLLLVAVSWLALARRYRGVTE